MHRSRRVLIAVPLFSLVLLLLSTLALRGFPVPVDRLLAATSAPAGPSVVVAPPTGAPTDAFTFSLAGFAANEAVSVTFTMPPGFDDTDFPAPDAMTTAVDAAGSGSFSLRPVDQGVILPGTWVVTFTGQTSGMAQTVSFALECGC